MARVQVLNLGIDNLTQAELLAGLDRGIIFTPNVDHLTKLQKDREFYQAYECADYRLCDGKILQYAARFLGSPIQEKISGSDFFPAFCDYHRHNSQVRVFLLGARPGIAAQAQININQKAGRPLVVGTYSPPFGFDQDPEECAQAIAQVHQSGANVLGVGLGAPKQEKFIARYHALMPEVKIFLAIGATIDFEAGAVPRSPQWMSNIGLEWFYRLMREPRRLWRRYLYENPLFLILVLQQKLGVYRDPFGKV